MAAAVEPAAAAPTANQPDRVDTGGHEGKTDVTAVGPSQGPAQQGPHGNTCSAASVEKGPSSLPAKASSGQVTSTAAEAAGMAGAAAAGSPADGEAPAEESGAKRQRRLAEPLMA